mgnify:FL=1
MRPAFGYYARVGEPLYPAVAWAESDLVRAEPGRERLEQADRTWLVESIGRDPALPSELAARLSRMTMQVRREFDGVRVTLLVAGD